MKVGVRFLLVDSCSISFVIPVTELSTIKRIEKQVANPPSLIAVPTLPRHHCHVTTDMNQITDHRSQVRSQNHSKGGGRERRKLREKRKLNTPPLNAESRDIMGSALDL
jgi:hypothetical protein